MKSSPRISRCPQVLCAVVSTLALAGCGTAAPATAPPSRTEAFPVALVSAPERSAAPGPLTRSSSLTSSISSIDGTAVVSQLADRMGNSASLAPLSGRMIGTLESDNGLLGADLVTGRFGSLAGNTELADLGVSHSDSTIDVRSDRGVASGAVLTIDDCREERDSVICVVFTDRNGNVTSSFDVDGELPGPAKTSFDGSHVVVDRTDRDEGSSVISLFTRSGELVDSFAQPNALERSGAYDFLPDGRLVFSLETDDLSDDQSTGFIITDPFDTTPQRRILLPAYYQTGRIQTIESSPDGARLLINVEPPVGPTRPILVELESLLVTQLIDREDGGSVNASSAVWDGEGTWIYVVLPTAESLIESAPDGGSTVFAGQADSLFVYRSDQTRQPMPEEWSDLSDARRLVPTDDPATPGGAVGGGQYAGDLVWIP